jgi:hypothetical protein
VKRLFASGSLWLLLSCCFITACQSVERSGFGAPEALVPGVTRRTEVYERFGPPMAVYERPDRSGSTLVYSQGKVAGIDLGFRVMVIAFSLANARSVTASMLVDLSRDDVVSRVRSFGVPPTASFSVWPFGD